MTAPAGYAHPDYAASLAEFGEVQPLPARGEKILLLGIEDEAGNRTGIE